MKECDKELLEKIQEHRSEGVTCDPSCWCWSAKRLICLYQSVIEANKLLCRANKLLYRAKKTISQKEIHALAREKGFWDAPRSDGECIALMHSELSECLEALRHGNPPDDHCPAFGNAIIELADCVIRIKDFCEAKGWDLEAAETAKHAFNKTRPYKHNKQF